MVKQAWPPVNFKRLPTIIPGEEFDYSVPPWCVSEANGAIVLIGLNNCVRWKGKHIVVTSSDFHICHAA